MPPSAPLSLEAVLTSMKDGAFENRAVLIRLTLILGLLSAAFTVAQGAGAFGQAVAFGASLLAGVVYVGMVTLVLCVRNGDDRLAGLWQSLSPVLAKLVWVSLLFATAVAAGLIMFIIPGLIILSLWIVAPQVAVVEKCGVFESLTRSRELVRGNGLRVFLFLLVLATLILVAATLGALIATPFGTGPVGLAIATFLVSVAVNPLTAVGPAALYSCLSDALTAGPESAEPDTPDPGDQARTRTDDFTPNGGQ